MVGKLTWVVGWTVTPKDISPFWASEPVNVVFGQRVFAEGKMRSSWIIQMDPKPNDTCSCKRHTRGRHKREGHEKEADWSYTATGQRWELQRKDSLLTLQRKQDTAGTTWSLDFWPLEHWKSKFQPFQATEFVVPWQ